MMQIRHVGVRVDGGRAYAPDMGGATTAYSLWSWPTLPEARPNHRIINGVGAIVWPVPGATFGVAGPGGSAGQCWHSGPDNMIEYRRYLVLGDGRALVPEGKYDLVEFPSEGEARLYLQLPEDYRRLATAGGGKIYEY